MLNEEQIDRVKTGAVLVCRITAPIWGALFGSVGALVTEHGEMLSHAATTAREFGIPAVVGVADATSAIRDGQIVEVGGTTGTIRLIEKTVRPRRSASASAPARRWEAAGVRQ